MNARAYSRVPFPVLMLVTDSSRLCGRSILDVVSPAVDGGVNVVQLRERSMPHDARIELARAVKAAIAGRALLLVNSDVDAVLESDADGVHLPDEGVDTRAIRARVGDRMIISRATHGNPFRTAEDEADVDLLVLGTIFATPSKPNVITLGLEGLERVASVSSTPIVAIGGITAINARLCMDTGASGIAVIGAIMDAADPRAAAAALRAAIATSDQRPATSNHHP